MTTSARGKFTPGISTGRIGPTKDHVSRKPKSLWQSTDVLMDNDSSVIKGNEDGGCSWVSGTLDTEAGHMPPEHSLGYRTPESDTDLLPSVPP